MSKPKTTLTRDALEKFDLKYRGLRHFCWSPKENAVLVVVGYNPVRDWIAVVNPLALPQSVSSMLIDLASSDEAQKATYLVGDMSILRRHKHPSGANLTWERFVLNEIASGTSRVAYHLDAVEVVYSSAEQVMEWGISDRVVAWGMEKIEGYSDPKEENGADDAEAVEGDDAQSDVEKRDVNTSGDRAFEILERVARQLDDLTKRIDKIENEVKTTKPRRGRPAKKA